MCIRRYLANSSFLDRVTKIISYEKKSRLQETLEKLFVIKEKEDVNVT